jgi:hypothetical protein
MEPGEAGRAPVAASRRHPWNKAEGRPISTAFRRIDLFIVNVVVAFHSPIPHNRRVREANAQRTIALRQPAVALDLLSYSPRWQPKPTTNKPGMSKDGCQKMAGPTDRQSFDNHFSTAFSRHNCRVREANAQPTIALRQHTVALNLLSLSPRWQRTPTTNTPGMSKDGCQKMESPTDRQSFDNHFSTALTVGCVKRTRNAPSPLSHCVLTRCQYPPHRPLAPAVAIFVKAAQCLAPNEATPGTERSDAVSSCGT